jgi:hypothetical protein
LSSSFTRSGVAGVPGGSKIVEALRLQEVAVDRGRHHLEVGRMDARRVDAGDERSAEEAARGGGRPARDDAVAAVERRAEGEPEAKGGLGRQVDVDPARDALHADQPRGETRLPDQVPVDEGAGLHLLEGVDPDARHDDAFLADRAVVPDSDAFVEARVRAQVAGPADDRSLDDRAAADRGRGVDDGAGAPRVVAERHAGHEDRVGADGGPGCDAAVVADEGGRLDRLEVVEAHPLPHPDVAPETDAGDAQPHALVQCVEVGLPVLVEVADVLPVAVADVAVERPPHLQQEGEELFREVVRPVGRDVAEHLRLEHVDAGVDRVGEDLAPARLLEEAHDAAVVLGDHDPELERVRDALQADRHERALLPVKGDEGAEVDVAERIS